MTKLKLLLDDRGWSRLAFFFPFVVYLIVYFIEGVGFHPGGDGQYSWMFARSLAFDGDIEFRNDYALCGDHFGVGVDRGTGHPDNPFYFGPAAFLVPPTLLLRAMFTLWLGTEGAARASCNGGFTALVFLVGPASGAITIWFSYQAARRLVPARIAAFTALLFAFSSPLFAYSSSIAHYSHVYLAATTAALAYVSVRMATSGLRRSDGLWLGALMALVVAHRLPSIVFGAIPLAAIAARANDKGARALAARNVVGLAIGSLIGVLSTGLVYHYLYGRWFAIPQGPDFMHLTHAHPWLVLFGVHGGLFFWTPATWLAVGGLVVAARRTDSRWLTLGVCVTAVMENFVSSAALDWYGGWTLGARRLVPLVPFFVIYGALAIEAAHGWIRRRSWSGWLSRLREPTTLRWLAGIALASALANGIHASLLVSGDRAVTQRDLYGAWSPLRPLWSWLDELGIDPAILPAEAYFVLRHRLPPTSYREALVPRYRRRYRNLVFVDPELDLTNPSWAKLTRGGEWSPEGIRVSKGEAHLVFTAEWPFATHVRIRVEPTQGGTLELRADRLFGDVAIGTVDVPATTHPIDFELPLPPGTFDSGINDWGFRAGGDLVVSKIVLEDRTPRIPYGVRSPGSTRVRIARSAPPKAADSRRSRP